MIAGAAARASARVSRLVYLDAFVADAGQSMFDLLRPERRAVYESTIRDGLIPSPPPEVFGITDPAQAAVDRRAPDPAAAAHVDRAARRRRRRCPARTSAAPRARSCRASKGFAARFEGEVVELAAGHDAMITRPTDLAGLIAQSRHTIGTDS